MASNCSRFSKISTDSSNMNNNLMCGYELLLLKRFQSDPELCRDWRDRLLKKIEDDGFDLGEIPLSLWYLAMTIQEKKERFLEFVKCEIERDQTKMFTFRESLLSRYLKTHMFTELVLDNIFKYGHDNTLPKEIFCCPSVKRLSMKYNYLDRIPPDIGRMSNLEYLSLTNNKLQTKSIPYTLTFCTKLKTLLLDNNLLDALPGFLIKMTSLETVHRHGNHNYFKSTFMWYHTDINERILRINKTNDFMARDSEKLQFWAAKSVIGSKINFFSDPNVAPVLRDYIVDIYPLFNVCGFCNCAKLNNESGYKVITFKNPYLGNTCVPFQHWACASSCATEIETPAHVEQIQKARTLDMEYDAYIRDCQNNHCAINSGSRYWFSRQSRFNRGSRYSSPNITLTGCDDDEEESEREYSTRQTLCTNTNWLNCTIF